MGAAGTSSGDEDGDGGTSTWDLGGDDKDGGSGARELVYGGIGLGSCGASVALTTTAVAKITCVYVELFILHETTIIE